MKKITTFLGIFLLSFILLSSCKVVQEAKFTSVENVFDLKIGFTLPEVISTLGSKPYNVYYKQAEGYTIYTYKYKLVERKFSPSLINEKGSETTGREVYKGKMQTLYLLFKNEKLDFLVTTDGRKDSMPLILLNNTLYTIGLEKEGYILVPTGNENPAEPGSNGGLLKKKKVKFGR